jgi:hypothetical protein
MKKMDPPVRHWTRPDQRTVVLTPKNNEFWVKVTIGDWDPAVTRLVVEDVVTFWSITGYEHENPLAIIEDITVTNVTGNTRPLELE